MNAAAGKPFPWDEVMAVGLGLLRLSPQTFWAMTPLEFERAMSALARRQMPPDRGDLSALMRAFPDKLEAGLG